MDTKTIGEIVRKQELEYVRGNVIISKYVTFSMFETINKIEAYLNSIHISGTHDSKGRKKPFFNISTAGANVWFRATDIDRSNIRIKPTNAKTLIPAYLGTILLQDWMRKNNFGAILNEWGRVLSRYGSAVVKFVEKSDGLHVAVIPWNRLIVDAIDFDSNIKIEILEFTEAQLRESNYDQTVVENLINTKKARETIDKRRQDNKNDYYKLYEVHGKFSLATLKLAQGKNVTEKDEKVFSQQMYVYSYVGGKNNKDNNDYILYCGEEAKDPYMITHLIKEDGRTLAIGAVEHMFEPQFIVNHSNKAIKDELDMASKLIYQTSDESFVGNNVLTAVENGDIMVHKPNQPITQIAGNATASASWQNFAQTWKALGNEINGISEAMLGVQKSGTAWRQTEALLQESHSLFELMTENKGLQLEDMLTKYIIPSLKKTLNNSDEIATTLSDYGIDKIESMYIKAEANKRAKRQIIDSLTQGKLPENIDVNAMQGQIKEELNQLGNVRFIKPSEVDDKTWKDLLKDLEWDVEIDITGEQKDTQAVMTTLNTLLGTLARLNGQPMSPEMKLVFNKILTQVGTVSPIELDSVATEAPIQPQNISNIAQVGAGGGGTPQM